jgi:hypothetical protein
MSKYVVRKHLCGAIIQWRFSYIYMLRRISQIRSACNFVTSKRCRLLGFLEVSPFPKSRRLHALLNVMSGTPSSPCEQALPWYLQFGPFLRLLDWASLHDRWIDQPNKCSFVCIQFSLYSFMNSSRLPLWSSEIQRSGFDSRRCQNFCEVVGLERGPLSLVSTVEELMEWYV